MKPTVAVYIRGHVRNAFLNKNLISFLQRIKNYCDFDLYFQTWNVSNTQNSWVHNRRRRIQTCNISTKSFDYFKGNFYHKIKDILILDDNKIQLVGNLDGNISKSNCKIKSWKNMWYGMHQGFMQIPHTRYDFVLNTRFDITENYLLKLCGRYNRQRGTKLNNISDFLRSIDTKMFNPAIYENKKTIFSFFSKVGCDNFIISDYNLQSRILAGMNYSLDLFLEELNFRNIETAHQEYVFKYYLQELKLNILNFNMK
jgi:hypothetical protein